MSMRNIVGLEDIYETIKNAYYKGYSIDVIINGEHYDVEQEEEWHIYRVYGDIDATYEFDYAGSMTFMPGPDKMEAEYLISLLIRKGFLPDDDYVPCSVEKRNGCIYIMNDEEGTAILELGRA